MILDKFRDVDLVIDKANDNFIQRQFVSQADYKGRTLTVQVTNNGEIGEVPGLFLNLRWQNQTSGLTDLSAFELIDKENNVFRIEYPEHMMTPGKVTASIQLIHDGKTLHMKQFELTVQKLAGEAVGIVEKAEYSALVAVLSDANKFRTDIDSLEIVKADKEDVFKVEEMVAKIPSATPKETFSNLAALKAKYPNGSISAMVVLEADGKTGYVYLWDGSSWKKGALYQAQGIADGSITAQKISQNAADGLSLAPVKTSMNLFNYQDNRIKEGYLTGSNYFEKHPTMYLEVSYPVYLNRGTICFTTPRNANLTVWHTDETGEYISHQTAVADGSGVFAKLEILYNGYYVFNLGEQIETVPAKKRDRYMISYNSFPKKYAEYKLESTKDVYVKNENVSDLRVRADEIEVLIEPENFFDISRKRENGKYVGLNGYYTHTDLSYEVTEPIHLKEGVYRCPYQNGYQSDYYCIEVTRQGRFLNSILASISENIATFVIDKDGYYRFNFRNGLPSSTTFMLVKNQYPEKFTPHKRLLEPSVRVAKENLDFKLDESSNVLNGKKWVVCGDSITAALKGDVDDEQNRKGYQYYVGKRNGMHVETNAISGSTMTNVVAKNGFSVSGRYDALGEGIDYLTIWFGINDAAYAELGTISDSTNTTFYGAWNVVMEYLVTNYPTTKIGLIVTFNGSTDFREAVRLIAKKWGVAYLDFMGDPQVPLISGRENGFGLSDVAKNARRNTFLADGTHPNDVGYQYISTIMENFLRGL